MKKKLSVFLSLALTIQLILALVVMPVHAENAVGSDYEVPEAPSVTYNMNMDWKFYDTKTDAEIWTAMARADKNGKKFYEKDYDDSAWEDVSIPHGIGGGTNSFAAANYDAGGGYRSVLLYRKHFTVPANAAGGKIFFELEGIRQAAYVWVNGQKVGYYEAGITAMGFDITSFVTPGEEAVIAICNDGTTSRGTTQRYIHETVPGQTLEQAYQIGIAAAEASLANPPEKWKGSDIREVASKKTAYEARLAALTTGEKNETWGTSFGDANDKTHVGSGAGFQWNTKDFNEPQIGLVYDAYLHVKGKVYQTLPLYNNLKTTGNYIYADNFDIKAKKATIHVDAEVRNETDANKNLTLQVDVVGPDGKLKWTFESAAKQVDKASDANVVYQTAVESDVYDEDKLANSVGITKVNTVDVTHIYANYDASDVRFWNIDDPYLYDVYTILKDGTDIIDVQKKTTGFRKITYSGEDGMEINDRYVWLPGYAQRSTNEWAVIGSANDWLNDYDMRLLKDSNADFIRWMHVSPKPAQVRSSDKYGVAVVVPAGDKEGVAPNGRQWSQRVEAMRDAIIYFRNSPSVVFYETGNSQMGTAEKAKEMKALYDKLDPHGMRFIGARSTSAANELDYDNNYAGTMYGNYADKAVAAMAQNGKMGPIMETEYNRDESPRRVWDDYSPPDFDYVNKYLGAGASKKDGYDVWDETQEDFSLGAVKSYAGFYNSRVGGADGTNIYTAIAMMVWSDSNMHTRNTGTENCRTSGRVDPVRQTKDSFYAVRTAQSDTAAVDILGHWSYPAVSNDTYNYFAKSSNGTYEVYDLNKKLKRDPTKKTVYVIGSADVAKVELIRVDKGKNDDPDTETVLGTCTTPTSTFIYPFANVDVTKGDAVIARAYDARDTLVAEDRIDRAVTPASIRITPVKSDKGWKADGADIVMFDVEVIDAAGNVCPLVYDKINFTYEGTDCGTYLGGYNSGMGANCFQNMAESAGLSKYFGGAKDGVSTLGKDYVYAENGTNRIFVKAKRTAGTFTLKATLCDASGNETNVKGEGSATSSSVANTNGLTTVMPDTETYTYADKAPEIESVPSLVSLSDEFTLNYVNDTIELNSYIKPDSTTYYTVKLNDEHTLSLPVSAYEGTSNSVFGPIMPVLDALKDLGADVTYTYDITTDPDDPKLTVYTGEHTIWCHPSENQVFVDDDSNLPNDFPALKYGQFCFEYAMILPYIDGLTASADATEHVYNITFEPIPFVSAEINNAGTGAAVTAHNTGDTAVTIYAAKYENGALVKLAMTTSPNDTVDFVPDKVFMWKTANKEPMCEPWIRVME